MQEPQALGQDGQLLLTEMETWFSENSENLVRCLIGIVISIAIFIVLLAITRVLIVPFLKRHGKKIFAESLLRTELSISALMLLAGLSISLEVANFPTRFDFWRERVFFALFILVALRLALRLVTAVCGGLADHFHHKNPEFYSMNKLLIELTKNLARFLFWALAGLFILQDVFCIRITALLASAGILGAGFAFAAQNTIANLLGAFSILGEKLFKEGDWIKVGDCAEGVVEEIGFRSVRLRAFEGRLIDVPNRLIADAKLENFSNRKFCRENFCFGLIYQTTPEQIQLALKILDEIGKDLAEYMVPGKPPRFHFVLCDSCSLNLDGFVWFHTTDWFQMREWRQQFNQEVFRRFNEAGLSFAYPTSTVFVEKK